MTADTTDAARADLRAAVGARVPPGVIAGSYNVAVEFKAAVAAANRALGARNATPHTLRQAAAVLRRFA